MGSRHVACISHNYPCLLQDEMGTQWEGNPREGQIWGKEACKDTPLYPTNNSWRNCAEQHSLHSSSFLLLWGLGLRLPMLKPFTGTSSTIHQQNRTLGGSHSRLRAFTLCLGTKKKKKKKIDWCGACRAHQLGGLVELQDPNSGAGSMGRRVCGSPRAPQSPREKH